MNHFIIIFLLGTWTSNAHAYLDPGTGSMLVQGLIAAIAGAVFFLRDKLSLLGHFLKRLTKSSKKTKATDNDNN